MVVLIPQVRGVIRRPNGTISVTDWYVDDGSASMMEHTLQLARSKAGSYSVEWERREIKVEADTERR